MLANGMKTPKTYCTKAWSLKKIEFSCVGKWHENTKNILYKSMKLQQKNYLKRYILVTFCSRKYTLAAERHKNTMHRENITFLFQLLQG